MIEEYQSIMKNDVWDVVPRPEGKSVVTSKWIYKIKHVADDSIEKYKEKFVAPGFSQKQGIDYEETFALVARQTSIRSVLSLAAVMKWKIHQMDVKTAFLNGAVEEEVYVEQPLSFETHDKDSYGCRLKKTLYGLKQVPRTWYYRIDIFLSNLGFTKSKEYSNFYYKVEYGNPVILLLYVDDLFVTGMDGLIADTKRKLAAKFEMKDLGMEVWHNADEISLG